MQLDLRELAFESEFDAAVNLFTAFGYFETDAEHADALVRVARALRPDGGFLIDTINTAWVLRHFAERGWVDGLEGSYVLVDRTYDVLSGRIAETWRFLRADGTRTENVSSIRAYTAAELASMLAEAELPVESAWGDFGGDELTMDSRRAILLGRKP